mmetsp:Transcript_33586/g.114066  ORF Transcript_33586/g.114066 Transcript_33586/m.114066 type:complete len:231 (-) Transcript_33586:904-1596(-)
MAQPRSTVGSAVKTPAAKTASAAAKRPAAAAHIAPSRSTVRNTCFGFWRARLRARGARDWAALDSASAKGQSRKKRLMTTWCAASAAMSAPAAAAVSTTPTTVFAAKVRKKGTDSANVFRDDRRSGTDSSRGGTDGGSVAASRIISSRSSRRMAVTWATQPATVARAVASAAPATPMPNPATRMTSKTTLTTAATNVALSGVLQSPRATAAACTVCQASWKGRATLRKST